MNNGWAKGIVILRLMNSFNTFFTLITCAYVLGCLVVFICFALLLWFYMKSNLHSKNKLSYFSCVPSVLEGIHEGNIYF